MKKWVIYQSGIMTNKSFFLFFSSQIISGFGDTFQFIAVTALILKITGSGLMTGFSMICASLPSLLLSLFAGSLGDRLPVKNLLIAIDILRCITAVAFAFSKSLLLLYILMLLLSSLDTFYSPPRNKMITNILSKDQLIMGNSVISGGYGVVYILGSTIAGLLVSMNGIEQAFIINGITFLISAFLITCLEPPKVYGTREKTGKASGLFQNIAKGLEYSGNSPEIRSIIGITTVISICVISINISFYSFAFDTLGVDSKGWGLILSILYGMNLTAMLIAMTFRKGISKASFIFAYILLFAVSIIWFSYSVVMNLSIVLALQAMEGTALSLCGIYLSTRLQSVAQKAYISRTFGANDLVNSIAKVFGVICTYIVLKFYPPVVIFKLSSALMLGFVLYKFFTFKWSRDVSSQIGG